MRNETQTAEKAKVTIVSAEYYNGFIAGEKAMLNKACEWLTANANKYASYAGMSNKLIDDFRKAMKAETCNSGKNLQELTWEDVKRITEIADVMLQTAHDRVKWEDESQEAYYTEVLKRFNEGE